MDEYTEFNYIITPMVSNMLEVHKKNVRKSIGIDNTEEEQELMDEDEGFLNDELEYIEQIQKDLINYLVSNGCKCINKYL